MLFPRNTAKFFADFLFSLEKRFSLLTLSYSQGILAHRLHMYGDSGIMESCGDCLNHDC